MKRFSPFTVLNTGFLMSLMVASLPSANAGAKPNDDFDVDHFMGEGSRLQGEVLDTRERRNYLFIENEVAAKYIDLEKYPPSDFHYVANY